MSARSRKTRRPWKRTECFLRLAALAEDDETALQNMLACAHAEKNRIAPDCAYCAMPCGSTSDLDFGTVRNAREAVRKQKFAITERLIEIAPGMLCKLESVSWAKTSFLCFTKPCLRSAKIGAGGA